VRVLPLPLADGFRTRTASGDGDMANELDFLVPRDRAYRYALRTIWDSSIVTDL
jgi:hypothetical protein